ncbi:50S ribosomal protein L21 [Aureimonas mangrovi]|uniref:50S ribosomal protein L21 n=1 Tax=Aureimonas mangrovi TaxID=2758041 RepID=UPI00163DDF7F|nr:50S ribosomal protein L21 [Aureimonas mangrovi]
MFAVIKTGGKQYRVAANDEFTIERVAGEAGDTVSFAEVLMVGTSIGAPFVSGASVVAEIVDQVRGPKVISFKKRRRQNSKRTRGHRQDLTLIRISEILTEGQKPSKKEQKAAAAETPAVTESATDEAPKAEKPKRATKKADAETNETATEAAAKKPRATKKKAEGADEA